MLGDKNPQVLRMDGDMAERRIFIDVAYRDGAVIVLAGWSTDPSVDVRLLGDGEALTLEQIKVSRPDVAEHFFLAETELGFVFVAKDSGEEVLSFSWVDGNRRTESEPLALKFGSELDDGGFSSIRPGLSAISRLLGVDSPQWQNYIDRMPSVVGGCPDARGYLELASADNLSGEGVVIGWATHAPGAVMWLENDLGNRVPLTKAFRRFRQDVWDEVAKDLPSGNRDSGFIVRTRGFKKNERIRLRSLSNHVVYTVAELYCGALPSDPISAARWLFSIDAPLSDIHKRFAIVDGPVIGHLIEEKVASNNLAQVIERQLGTLIDNPKVSLIIPLYGRWDFVEHQLIEFVKDDWLRRHAEIIYVIDDPRIYEEFRSAAERLYRLYQLPFKWVWGGMNRGFSGANNLGVSVAAADSFVFLNSDVFPSAPGWLEVLLGQLASDAQIGAVAPRLVFADGSIQHAGMQFLRREELGIWINHHPYMGLAPKLDPYKVPTETAAITGACLVVSRAHYEAIGGWDTGYLIGDFEDSDFCLRLRSIGLKVVYVPMVQMTHLERQSFKLLGQDDFRMKVVIFNAVRHQGLWEPIIETIAN